MTTSRSHLAINATGLRKSFVEHVVLDGIDLRVAEGTIFSLLGPNGAGKTTVVNILSTLIRPDAGDVQIAGHDLDRDPDGIRPAIGVTGQFSTVDNLLTGEENLLLMADLRRLGRRAGRPRTAELLSGPELHAWMPSGVLHITGLFRRWKSWACISSPMSGSAARNCGPIARSARQS